MTCIIALKDKGTIWMGGDSASSTGWNTRLVRHPKVFELRFSTGNMLIGYTSSFRMGQLLEYYSLPEYGGRNVMKYMVKDFVPAIRDVFNRHGYAGIDNNKESAGEFIVGFDNHIFGINSDYAVQEYIDSFHSVGCGAPYALGAMSCLAGGAYPEQTIVGALEIAAKFSNGVQGPFTVLKI